VFAFGIWHELVAVGLAFVVLPLPTGNKSQFTDTPGDGGVGVQPKGKQNTRT